MVENRERQWGKQIENEENEQKSCLIYKAKKGQSSRNGLQINT